MGLTLPECMTPPLVQQLIIFFINQPEARLYASLSSSDDKGWVVQVAQRPEFDRTLTIDWRDWSIARLPEDSPLALNLARALNGFTQLASNLDRRQLEFRGDGLVYVYISGGFKEYAVWNPTKKFSHL